MNFEIRFSTPMRKQLSPKAATLIVFAFSFVFITVGTLISTMLLRNFLYEISVADRAVEVPCKIVSAEISTSHGSRGSVSYSPAVAYEYQYNFQDFASDEIEFSQSFSSGDYGKAKKRLNALKNRTTCWVDPEEPRRAALERPIGEFRWSKFFIVLIPQVFTLFGVLVLVVFFIGRRKEKAKLAAAGTQISENSENLENSAESVPAEPPSLFASIYSIVFPIIWTGFAIFIMSMFIVTTWPENTPISAGTLGEFFKKNFIMLFFTGSFVVIGFIFLFASICKFIADRRAAERSRDESFARNRGKWER